MDTFNTYRLLLIIALIGVPAAAIYWSWRSFKKQNVQCSCGGQVTPLGGHGPCGCCLGAQPIQSPEWEERRADTHS